MVGNFSWNIRIGHHLDTVLVGMIVAHRSNIRVAELVDEARTGSRMTATIEKLRQMDGAVGVCSN